MYKLKSIARRFSLLGSVVALVAAGFLPAASTFADALNPLTNRSLTLSSSSPGWSYTDGSGNASYAPPNSGANGQKTGNTFSFNVSTDSHSSNTIKGFTFQYCTNPAGDCTAPGDDTPVGTLGAYTSHGVDDTTHSDLNVATSTPTEIDSTTYGDLFDTTATDPNGGDNVGTLTTNTKTDNPSIVFNPSLPANTTGVPPADDSEGNFVVETLDAGTGTWVYSPGWAMAATNSESGGSVAAGTETGKNNYITLTNSTGGLSLHTAGAVKVIFFATDDNYITNPGSGAFFVKINDYNSDTTLDDTTLVDGGVTVANVMNQSIEIQTKVLETMDFSVGTVDPDTLNDTQLAASPLGEATHGQCDAIQQALTPADITAGNANVLQLGDTSAENSLSTSATYSTHSYFRLSSNSSAGATVYYAGATLSNTEGDQIQAIGTTPEAPSRGSPQFGLALDNSTGPNYAVDYSTEHTSADGLFENAADITLGGVDSSVATDIAAGHYGDYHAPQLAPLTPESAYADGTGVINGASGLKLGYGTVNTEFAFDPNSYQVPAPLASENASVVDCVTGKVRYIANIAATTPAGIYTTKVNYIAAPQY